MTKRSRRRDRLAALQMAATVMAGHDSDLAYAPKLWSLSVFFERYLTHGCRGTQKDFGPKKPVKLRKVGDDK